MPKARWWWAASIPPDQDFRMSTSGWLGMAYYHKRQAQAGAVASNEPESRFIQQVARSVFNIRNPW